jgi:succinylarginine dihydrolase
MPRAKLGSSLENWINRMYKETLANSDEAGNKHLQRRAVETLRQQDRTD